VNLMGVDTSVTHSIFFIAAIIVATSLAGTFIAITYHLADDLEAREQAVSDTMLTDLVIINDPQMMPYSESQLSIYAKNTGSISINHNRLTVFVDGEYLEPTVQLMESAAMTWRASEVAEIIVTVDLSPGDHQVKVITDNGVSDTMLFRI
jgi:flagellar protein FlaG